MRLTYLGMGFLATLLASNVNARENSTFYNPAIPGWSSDPSCTRVEDTFYCVTSSFVAFPGLPVWASKDLKNWQFQSFAWAREDHVPGASWNTTRQQDGMWAPTIRYYNGEFFVICSYILNGASVVTVGEGSVGVLFRTKNITDDMSWRVVHYDPLKIDPDIFFDDDGKVYMSTQGIVLQELNIDTGEVSWPPINLWNGTGGQWPEAPHIYKRDGWYYLMIAEGGTGLTHAVTMARAKNITGPYEPHPQNPILTNRGTNQYYQRVGHGDLFTDSDGNWWAMVHSSRCGPEFQYYPMGREAVLVPARWDEGQWPIIDPVRGELEVWPLPEETREIGPGDGYFNGDPIEYDWNASSKTPRHFFYHRAPRPETFRFTDNGLEITPSRTNLTGKWNQSDLALTGQRGNSFITHRQTHTIFNFTVDVSLPDAQLGREHGITAFFSQETHYDISVRYHRPCNGSEGYYIRFNAVGIDPPPRAMLRLPDDVATSNELIRLHINAPNRQEYVLGYSIGDGPLVPIASGNSTIISRTTSGSANSYMGVLLGAYATCNGAGEGLDCPDGKAGYFNRWRYNPIAQEIEPGQFILA